MKKILIVAMGISVDGGIGNCLFKMLQMIVQEYPAYKVDLMLYEMQDVDLITDSLNTINVIPIIYNTNIDLSTKELVLKITTPKDRRKNFRLLRARVLHKFDYKLPLMNFVANEIEDLSDEYDVAISYSAMPTYISSFVANRVKAKQKILWVHGDIDQNVASKIKGLSSMKIRGLKSYQSIISKYDDIIAVSNGVKNSVCKTFPNIQNKAKTIYNFIDRDLIVKKSKEFLVDWEKSNFNILTVGRVSLEKGIDLAIETIELLADKNVAFRWYFVGYNQIPAYLLKKLEQKYLKEHFILLGVQENPYPYFNACDVYVHTSYMEGYCTATNEARMLGKPVITTDVAGAREQIQDGWNGFVVQKDSRSICEAIMKLIEHPELREQFSKNNALIEFSNGDSIKKIKELLK